MEHSAYDWLLEGGGSVASCSTPAGRRSRAGTRRCPCEGIHTGAQAIAEVLAALKVVALEARVLDLPAKQAIT